MNVEIVQGRIVDPASKLDATGGVYIANGRIAGIGQVLGRVHQRAIEVEGDQKGAISHP